MNSYHQKVMSKEKFALIIAYSALPYVAVAALFEGLRFVMPI